MEHTAENTAGLAWKAIDQAAIGANILKRTIEHMCAGPFDHSREEAMDILNAAIEECFANAA